MKKKTRASINISGNEKCDICKKVMFLVEHHINGRDIPNANSSFNLAKLCPDCHLNTHMGKIIIEKWAMTTEGRILLWHKKEDNSITGTDAKTHIIPH